MIADEVNVNREAVRRILTEELEMRKTTESRGDGLLEAGVWHVKDRTCAERRDKKKIAEKKRTSWTQLT